MKIIKFLSSSYKNCVINSGKKWTLQMLIPQYPVLVLKLSPIYTVSLNKVFFNLKNRCYPGTPCIIIYDIILPGTKNIRSEKKYKKQDLSIGLRAKNLMDDFLNQEIDRQKSCCVTCHTLQILLQPRPGTRAKYFLSFPQKNL